jgi:hypothetical protein
VEALLGYLNQGGSLEALQEHLSAASRLPPGTPGLLPLDFDADGMGDLVVVILSPSPQMVIPPGELFALRCAERAYQLVTHLASDEFRSAPLIHAAEDLTGDGAADILLGMQFCGAHTCFQSLQALVWNGQALENRLQGSAEDLPTPSVRLERNPPRIVVTAHGINSIGAGPFRPLERAWSWDPAQAAFIPSEDRLLDSPYRIHKLHDADRALRAARYEEALLDYLMVRDDPQLRDWTDPPRESAALGAFADYRRILTLLAMGKAQEAQSALQDMRQRVAAGSPGAPYLALAEQLWGAYAQENTLQGACAQVRAFAEEAPEAYLNPLYFGYANPSYEIQDLCPW